DLRSTSWWEGTADSRIRWPLRRRKAPPNKHELTWSPLARDHDKQIRSRSLREGSAELRQRTRLPLICRRRCPERSAGPHESADPCFAHPRDTLLRGGEPLSACSDAWERPSSRRGCRYSDRRSSPDSESCCCR